MITITGRLSESGGTNLIRIRVTRPEEIALVCGMRLDVYDIFHALSPRNSEDETEPFQGNVIVIF